MSAVNRIRAAIAPPKKGETFELRAGLVYVIPQELT
jgi:AP-1 complex subunit beta-1